MNICVLAGGQSTEHAISLISAENVVRAIPDKYRVFTVAIDRDGKWFWFPDGKFALHTEDPSRVCIAEGGIPVLLGKTEDGVCLQPLHPSQSSMQFQKIDVLFPVLHGKNGEDGAVQGLAQLTGCPCVGCSMTSSAVAMDKSFTKKVLAHDGIVSARWVDMRKGEDIPDVSRLGMPLFVKPANAGSSVGVVKVSSLPELSSAIEEALKYDEKVLIEEAIVGREIECAVLGNAPKLFCPAPGEIVPEVEFYSFDAKYTMAAGARVVVPAPLSDSEQEEVCTLAKRIYRLLGCKGFARVDFFYDKNGKWVFNEINTIPGFTNISMYPKLMAAGGIPYGELVDRLICLALES